MAQTTTKATRVGLRMASLAHGSLLRCAVPGCTRPPSARAGNGFSTAHCRYHIQHLARHGSLWHSTYAAAELRPYSLAALRWINENRSDIYVAHALQALRGTLDNAGHVESAMNLRGVPADKRARIAFARLREAGIEPERMLAIYIGVCGLIEEDRGSHRVEEFRIVQAAKALHRLSSGTHRRWDWPLNNGTTAPLEVHRYPPSSGQVLRVVGRQIARASEFVESYHLQKIIALKNELYGPHLSTLPGWKPEWRRKLDAAQAARANAK